MKFREIEEVAGANNFLKLKDKESVVGVFAGDPREFFVKWENNKSREVPEGTPDASFRFRINFVVREGSQFVPKIWEQGVTVYRQLAELHSEYDLTKTYMKVTRQGTGTDTTYSLLPSKKEPTEAERAHIKTLKLHELSGKKEASTEAPAPFDEDAEIPF